MSKPAFIIDGFTEKLILEKICPGSKITRTDLNGKTVTIKAIAKKISSLIKLLGNKFYPIIIVVDKEDREESCDKLIDELTTELKQNGCEDQDMRVFFADRMIENWIIADWDILKNSKDKPLITDGLRGSKIIKESLGSYSKTIDGVNLFVKCDSKIIYKNSPSFKQFIDGIQDIDCYYKDII
ncbi:DUF4276 family protein [Chryseobacterium foetidum]|uniref:DUF4276 family protein n=1 Tax=Chryseobacterium foetidum TaxID=2951057 RepID=UPI0021C9E83D|nr:DUF4276 family protein [Chryseobacterium foetidum]